MISFVCSPVRILLRKCLLAIRCYRYFEEMPKYYNDIPPQQLFALSESYTHSFLIQTIGLIRWNSFRLFFSNIMFTYKRKEEENCVKLYIREILLWWWWCSVCFVFITSIIRLMMPSSNLPTAQQLISSSLAIFTFHLPPLFSLTHLCCTLSSVHWIFLIFILEFPLNHRYSPLPLLLLLRSPSLLFLWY